MKKYKKTAFLFRTLRAAALLSVCALLLFALLNFLFPFEYRVNYSQVVYSKQGRILQAFLTPDDKWRLKAELDEITPDLQKAIIAKEDKYFYRHFGVNPLAVLRAAFSNIVKGKKVSGASTITMQVVRLLRPKPRTYLNKCLEAFHALQLETQLPKKEILQMYLNLVPYGGNVEGVKSASLLYFDKMPEQLSLAQLTALSIVPNRPTSWALGRHNPLLQKERNRWLRHFLKEKVFALNIIEDALKEPLMAKRRTFKKTAPHFSLMAKRQEPSSHAIRSSIDEGMQIKINKIAEDFMLKLRHYGIYNASVLVIENQTRKVRAYLGSQNFWDSQNAGQVDGVRALRSPGSTLKPLVYAVAFDKGIYTPKHTVLDLPVDFGGYRPHNFDKSFNGRLSVEKALSNSLNVPAVKALNEIGVPVFVEYLKKASFEHISKHEKRFGLSLALGGCGVSLWEMCGLYSAFADGGRFMPLSYLETDTLPDIKPLCSPAAAYMTSEILSQLERPDYPNNYQNSTSVPKIAWKTGTSYGRKDAWSIGYNKKYTIGVWVGNFSGKGVQELTGATIATPLLFKIFDVIDYQSKNEWFAIPDELDYRQVCELTGLMPSDNCQNLVSGSFIPNISSSERCGHLGYVFVDEEESLSYCSECLPQSGYKKKLYENYPPELIAYYRFAQIPYQEPPPHNEKCGKLSEGEAPLITNPKDNRTYYSLDGGKVELMLACHALGDTKFVYWYADNIFLGKHPSEKQVFVHLERGRHKISCTDDKGRNRDIFVTVR